MQNILVAHKKLDPLALKSLLQNFSNKKAFLGIGLLLIPLVIELGHAFWVWQGVSNAAQSGVRYAVTNQYMAQFCILDCATPTWLEAARMRSIRAEVERQLTAIGWDKTSAPSALAITICSNRPGFRFDTQNSTCSPYEDAGSGGGEVIVSVEYAYPLGGLWGVGVAAFPIRVTRQGEIESFRSSRNEVLPEGFGGTTINSNSSNASTERLVIMTGHLQLVTPDVDAGIEQITTFAKEAGGYVVQSTLGNEGEHQIAEIVIRVEATQFEQVLEKIRALSTEPLVETITGQDVTEEYVDLEARLRGLQATAAQLDTLLAQAKTVEETLQVSIERGKLQEQIEQALGRQQYLENQVKLATLTISISTEAQRSTLAPLNWQPNSTIESAFRFLTASVYFIGDLLIWAVIVAVPVLLIILALNWGFKRLRRKDKA